MGISEAVLYSDAVLGFVFNEAFLLQRVHKVNYILDYRFFLNNGHPLQEGKTSLR